MLSFFHPRRIKSNFPIGLEFDRLYISEANTLFTLDQYQINTIPVRKLSWFQKMDAIAEYCLGNDRCKYISAKEDAQYEHLFMLQNFGYRFIKYDFDEK
jgi:hypothetical protein